MLSLLQVLGIYLVLAVVVLYVVWTLIGRRGFADLEDTNSRLARHFLKSAQPEPARVPGAPAHP
jgi:hypothetical protein